MNADKMTFDELSYEELGSILTEANFQCNVTESGVFVDGALSVAMSMHGDEFLLLRTFTLAPTKECRRDEIVRFCNDFNSKFILAKASFTPLSPDEEDEPNAKQAIVFEAYQPLDPSATVNPSSIVSNLNLFIDVARIGIAGGRAKDVLV